MAKVHVVNDNTLDHREKFRDEMIFIPAKSSIEMEYDDAHLFLGQYFPIKRDSGGQQTPDSFKMLRIVQGEKPFIKQMDELRCVACNQLFTDKVELDKHITDAHLQQLADKDEKEKREKALQAKDKK